MYIFRYWWINSNKVNITPCTSILEPFNNSLLLHSSSCRVKYEISQLVFHLNVYEHKISLHKNCILLILEWHEILK